MARKMEAGKGNLRRGGSIDEGLKALLEQGKEKGYLMFRQVDD